MPRPQVNDRTCAPAFMPEPQCTRYLVNWQRAAWFIMFRGEEYGPYRSKREAKLFAIDAAYKLGQQGKQTEVIVSDEVGNLIPAWIFGQHSYPPRE
jgi:hypothetical protein